MIGHPPLKGVLMNQSNDKKTVWKAALREFPLTALVAARYVIFSAIFNLWHPLWMIFLLIPLIESLRDAIRLRNPHRFAYPVLCLLIFFCLGFFMDLWHPGWLVFLTIPLYYSLFISIKRKRAKTFSYPVLMAIVFFVLGFGWGLWHPGWAVFVTIPVYYAIVDWIRRFF